MNNWKTPDGPTLAALQEWFSIEAKYQHFHSDVVERMERTLAAAGKAAREAAPTRSIGDQVELTYTNWRGETAVRKLKPLQLWFGATDWHPEAQWLLRAFDVEKQAERDFALKDFGAPSPSAGPQAAWHEDSTGYFHMSLDIPLIEGNARDNGHEIHYLYGDPVEPQTGADADTRPRYSMKRMRDETAKSAERERLRFEGDLDRWMKAIGAGITGFQPEAYFMMDHACAELVKLRSKVAELKSRYENWRPIYEPPHEIQMNTLLSFWCVESDDEEGYWSTGSWDDRPETAQMWCSIVSPLGPHSEQIVALQRREAGNSGSIPQ